MQVSSFEKHWVSECPHCFKLIISKSFKELNEKTFTHFWENERCRIADEELPKFTDIIGILNDSHT